MGTKLKILTFSSVLLNFLLIGIVIGYFSGPGKRHRPPFRPPTELAQQLPPDKAALFTDSMKKLRKENRKTRKELRKTRQEVLAILTAPTFNAQAYQEKIDQLHNLHGQMKDRLSQTIQSLAAQFNQQERQVLAKFMEQKKPRRRPKHHRPHHHPPGPPPHGGPEGPPPPHDVGPPPLP